MARGTSETGDAGRLSLDERLPLRLGLGAAFAGVVAHARAMAETSQEEPVRAVHEVRKALRRSRAVVRLARPVLAPEVRRGLMRELRRALRGTSPLRDAAVVLQTLDALPERPGLRRPRRALRALLEQEQEAASAESPGAELRRSLARVLPLPQRVLAGMPERVRWRELRAGLERSYRRARRACRRALATRRDVEVHAFRKRVKELRYQLELLDAAEGGPGRELRRLALLAEGLGEVTDLTLLRRLARLHREELARSGARPEPLLAALDEAIAERLDALEGPAGKLFASGARRFGARAARAFH